MKKLITLVLIVVMIMSVPVGCGKKDSGSALGEAQAVASEENKGGEAGEGQREPMASYELLGVSNTMATSDGRYIYYSFKTDGGGMCRTDMNGENVEELYDSWLSDLYIDDGYLYYGHGVVLYRVDIATGPEYFDSSNGYINSESVVDKEMLGDHMGVGEVRSDDEYIYFTGSGLSRVKKGTQDLEEIAHGEDFINFYDLTVENGFLYAYCSDDGKIYRISPDGSDASVIYDVAGTYQFYDGYVYSIEREDGVESLMRTGLDDGKTERVGTLGEDGYVFASFRNAMADKLYYVCSNDNNNEEIRSYDLTTGEDRVIVEVDAYIEKVDIVGDFIFFQCSDYSLMRVNADGSGLVQVGT